MVATSKLDLSQFKSDVFKFAEDGDFDPGRAPRHVDRDEQPGQGQGSPAARGQGQ